MNAPSEAELKHFLNLLESVSENEARFITGFRERHTLLREHREKAFKLASLLSCMRGNTPGKKEDMRREVMETAAEFSSLLEKLNGFYEEEKEKAEEAGRKEKTGEKAIRNFHKILKKEISEAIELYKSDSGFGRRAARQKLEEISAAIHEEIRAEEYHLSIDRYLEHLLEQLESMISQQHKIIAEEKIIASAWKKIKTPIPSSIENRARRDEKKLKELARDFTGLLKREKTEFYDLFEKFLEKKTRIEKLLEKRFGKLEEGAKISAEDIKRDLYSFSNPDEVSRYVMHLMYKNYTRFMDEQTARWLLRLGRTAAYQSQLLRKRQRAALENQKRDYLTGFFTKQVTDRKLPEKIEEWQRSYRSALERGKNAERIPKISIMFIDIDDFGKFNKRFGQATGDAVLRFFGKKILENVHGKDIVGRYGGEEFIIIWPGLDKEKAKEKAKKIFEAVTNEKHHYTNGLDRNDRNYDEFNGHFTFSGGLATFPDDLLQPDAEHPERTAKQYLHEKYHSQLELLGKHPDNLAHDLIKVANRQEMLAKEKGKARIAADEKTFCRRF